MENLKCIVTINKQREELINSLTYKIKKLIDKDPSVFNKNSLQDFCEVLCKKFSAKFINSWNNSQIYQFVKQRFLFASQYFSKDLFVSITPFSPEAALNYSSDIVVEFILKDRAFVVDSLVEYLREKRLDIDLIVHPLLQIESSKDGHIDVREADDATETKLLYVFAIIKGYEIKEKLILRSEITDLIEMVRCVTDDFGSMADEIDKFTRKKKGEKSESLMESERRRLFTWFNAGNVILLGSGELFTDELSGQLEWKHIHNPLGYARRKEKLNDSRLPEGVGKRLNYFFTSNLYVNLIELGEFSEVHRKDRIQLLFAKRKTKEGKNQIIFFYLLFTNKSMNERAMAIPLARLKVNYVLERHVNKELNSGKDSHLTKLAHDFFSAIPKSELFRLDRTELDGIFMQLLNFGDNQTTQLNTYTKTSQNYARVTFCLPNHKFSQDIFERIEGALQSRLQVKPAIKYCFSLGRNAYSHYIFWFPDGHPQLEDVNLHDLEQEAAALTMDWEEQFQEILDTLLSSKRNLLKERYHKVFNPFYQAVFKPHDAIRDIEFIESLLQTGREQADLRNDPDKDESLIYIFSERKYSLTVIMPYLQNLSLTVIDENTYTLNVHSKQIFIYTYYVKNLEPYQEKFPGFYQDFCQLLLRVLEKRSEDDPLNGLLLKAGLNSAEIDLFILYRNYYCQLGASNLPINKSFLDNPEAVFALKNYFSAKFDPKSNSQPLSDERLSSLKKEAFKAVDKVKTLTDDIVFKNVFNLMESTIRTNYFNVDQLSALAVKVESAKVEYMPLPRPLYEIYVHGVDMEGIHLRGAKVARGGLRHSDRHDDFRAEILDLVNTQVIKNVIIVPDGSKGGFITKKIRDNSSMAAERTKQYRIYINSLLSLTDNIVEGETVHPNGVVCYDDYDPYLVVAADKGTAALSDTANEISANRKFWLGDAFASGGRHGYDHKGMGITARGAWECVKLHFLELGKDIQKSDFTVIGIGDMSGDVFGNGMLLSKHIRLLGAFNHLHIFIDPDPNPASSWKERKRLFDAPGFDWSDFDSNIISKGGGVYLRSAKSIILTPEIKKMLETGKDQISGEEMIRLLLQREADLLWNGGIGTYVKAADESAHQVGDAANDAVRINADQLRVKVVGEGGNLGLTQAARLEAAVRGVKLNTDALDNSGGVDTSDHEVNLKILMSSLMEQGTISSMDERNTLLEKLTDEVGELALEDNKEQGRAISMDNYRSQENIRPFTDVIQILTEEGVLNPKTTNISSSEKLNQLFHKGLGAPRPDLALLLSFSKMYFRDKIIDSQTLDDPYLDDVYYNYFPQSFVAKNDISQIQHPLKKEIIATVLVNKLVNQAGVTLLPEMGFLIELDAINIVIAYMITDQVFELGELREAIIKQLLTKDIKTAYRLIIRIENFIKGVMTQLLFRVQDSELKFSLASEFKDKLAEYHKAFDKLMLRKEKNTLAAKAKKLVSLGLSSSAAKKLAKLDLITNSLEVIILSQKTKISVTEATMMMKGIDYFFHFRILYNKISQFSYQSVWGKRHKALLLKQLLMIKQEILESILYRFNDTKNFSQKLELFKESNREQFKKYRANYNQLMKTKPLELCGVAVLLDDISRMLA